MILVTGASGLLGAAVCRQLYKQGVPYFAHLGSGSGSPTKRVPADVREHATLKAAGDLCNREHVEGLFKLSLPIHVELPHITGVIHCAARISGIAGQKADPSYAVTDNLCMTARLLEAAAKAGLKDTDGHWGRFVFVSSSTVYPSRGRPMHEDDDLGPDACYEGVGNMKIYCEQLPRFYRNKFGLCYSAVRPTAVYGVGDWSNHVIPDLLRRALAGETPLKVWGGISTIRDFVYVDDVAEACVRAAKGPDREGAAGPFNVGSGQKTTILDLARAVLHACDRSGDAVLSVDGPEAIPYRQVSIARAATGLGWSPQVTLEEGLRRTAEWMKHGT